MSTLPRYSNKSSSQTTTEPGTTEKHSPETKQSNEDWAPRFDDALRPWIPPGEYSATCVGSHKYWDQRYRRESIVLEFSIAEGDHAGTKLLRFYPLNGRVSNGSTFVREWVIANQGFVPRRPDRMPPSKFRNKLFRVRVETVIRTWDGGTHPPTLRYSKVAAVLELLVTNEAVQ